MLSDQLTQAVAEARSRGARLRPRVAGFPYLAESLRQANVTAVHCEVASMATTYRTPSGAVLDQQEPLVRDLRVIVPFDTAGLIAALRRDQRGETTYAEFMDASWRAGVISYDIDLIGRTCTYYGADATVDVYVEHYPLVGLDAAESPRR